MMNHLTLRSTLARLAFSLAFTLATTTTTFAADAPPQPSAEKKPAEKKGPAKPYPLDVCIVTDNDLGSMGEETSLVYEGQTIKFCCAPCEKKFLKNPARYLAKLAPESAPPATTGKP